MMKMNHKWAKKEGGFTLLELVVVVLIIGILTTIAVMVNIAQRAKAAEATVISDLRNMGQLMEEYEITFLRYPISLPDMPLSPGVVLTLTEDGTCVIGNKEGYTPEEITWYYDSVSNTVTHDGCQPPTFDDPLLGIVNAAIYSGAYFTSTNAWTVVGQSADVYVGGNYSCNSYVTTDGDLIAHGDVYMTNQCFVGGNVIASGSVTMTSNAQVAKDINTMKYVELTNTCGGSSSTPCSSTSVRIGGNINAFYQDGQNGIAKIFKISDGTTEAHLVGKSDIRPDGQEVLGGIVQRGNKAVTVPIIPWPKLYYNPNPTPKNIAWNTFFNSTKTLNGAPSWVGTSCTMVNASWSVNGNISILEPTVINTINDCPGGVTMNGQWANPMRVTLYGDLTIYAKKFSSQAGGLTFVSGDGNDHRVRIISPLASGANSPDDMASVISSYGIDLGSVPVTTDSKTSLLLYTPGRLVFGNGADFRGQAVAGMLNTSGAVVVTYVPIPEW